MSQSRKRVLFVCIANACRSPMAEGFARLYGSDVMDAFSAGMQVSVDPPAEMVMVMEEKNCDMTGHRPRDFWTIDPASFDLIVNMSGMDLPLSLHSKERKWTVEDPWNQNLNKFRDSRDTIENLVMQLILELRRRR